MSAGKRRRRRRRKKSLLLLLGECLDGDDETIEKKMSLLSLPFSAHSLAHEGDRAVLARQKGVERRVLGRDNLGDIDAGLGEGLSVFVGGGREAFFLSRPSFSKKKHRQKLASARSVRDHPVQKCTRSRTQQREIGVLSALARRERPWSFGRSARGGRRERGSPALEEIALRVDATAKKKPTKRAKKKKEIEQSFAPARGLRRCAFPFIRTWEQAAARTTTNRAL